MYLHVVEERQLDAFAPGVPFRDRQQQQRHPGQRGQHDDASKQQLLQRISGQARPPPELIQRPAQDQREVAGRLRKRVDGVVSGCAHFDSFVFATRIRLSWAALTRAS